jgi:3'(2'), 5'-bisphosphate nucleotidase
MEASPLAKEIIRIAEQASAITLKYHRQNLEVDYKKDEFDPVTVADQESDDFIREEIRKLFPKDLILSEENDNIPNAYDGRVWMIDPLDGTKSFLKGKDNFSINIGLLENGRPAFGCVAVPARGQIFYAAKGQGAYEMIGEEFRKLQVSDIKDIEAGRLITRDMSGEIRPIEEKINLIPFRKRIPEGGIGTKLCLIASGKAEAHINTNFRASKWDTLGPQVIVE